jgi:hypothetical protein
MLVNSVYSFPGFLIFPHSLSIYIFCGLGWTKIPLSAITDTVLLCKVAFDLKLQYTRTFIWSKNKWLFRTLICSKNKLLFSDLIGTACCWLTGTRNIAALSPTKDESWLPRVFCQWVWGSELLWRSYWQTSRLRQRIIFYTFFWRRKHIMFLKIQYVGTFILGVYNIRALWTKALCICYGIWLGGNLCGTRISMKTQVKKKKIFCMHCAVPVSGDQVKKGPCYKTLWWFQQN